MSTAIAAGDERLARSSTFVRVMRRPEIGALMGAIVVYVFFSAVDTTGTFVGLNGAARWTDVAATTGIVAVAVALLMIGGEFDLSAGVMVGTSGLFAGLLISEYNIPVWPAIALTFVFAACIGLLNGHELGGGLPMYTGPGFVVQDNATLVQELATNGTR